MSASGPNFDHWQGDNLIYAVLINAHLLIFLGLTWCRNQEPSNQKSVKLSRCATPPKWVAKLPTGAFNFHKRVTWKQPPLFAKFRFIAWSPILLDTLCNIAQNTKIIVSVTLRSYSHWSVWKVKNSLYCEKSRNCWFLMQRESPEIFYKKWSP